MQIPVDGHTIKLSPGFAQGLYSAFHPARRTTHSASAHQLKVVAVKVEVVEPMVDQQMPQQHPTNHYQI